MNNFLYKIITMKNEKKLSLTQLKVSSFETSIDRNTIKTVKGGSGFYCTEPTDPDPCGSHGCPSRVNCGGTGGGGGTVTIHCGQSMDISGPCAC